MRSFPRRGCAAVTMLPELRNHKIVLTGTVYIISVNTLRIKLIRTRSHNSSYSRVAVISTNGHV